MGRRLWPSGAIGRGSTPKLKVPDRLETTELAFKLQNVVFPVVGKYEFRLIANGDLIAQKTVGVAQAGDPSA